MLKDNKKNLIKLIIVIILLLMCCVVTAVYLFLYTKRNSKDFSDYIQSTVSTEKSEEATDNTQYTEDTEVILDRSGEEFYGNSEDNFEHDMSLGITADNEVDTSSIDPDVIKEDASRKVVATLMQDFEFEDFELEDRYEDEMEIGKVYYTLLFDNSIRYFVIYYNNNAYALKQ